MKKCTQCGQAVNDDTKFCFKCGGAGFEQIAEASGGYQQPAPQAAPPAAPQQAYYAPQPAQPTYQQAPAPVYQQQPMYQGQSQMGYASETATVGNFLVFFLLMLVPIFNIIYFIMVAVGGPKYPKSLSNFTRAALIWGAIILVIYIVLIIVFGASLFSALGSGYYGY